MIWQVDLSENLIGELSEPLLEALLIDRTTGHNIIWATDDYASLGSGYLFEDEILPERVTGEQGALIQPRVLKDRAQQRQRSKDKAEVFTPFWVCQTQNDLIDEAWFGRKGVIDWDDPDRWEKITFPAGKDWKAYVKDLRLEITCGEAPYLASRYDTTTGEPISIRQRIGLLDRKLWFVHTHTSDKTAWWQWAQVAFQSVYGYEWQGDNVLLARENLLATFVDFHQLRWDCEPSIEELLRIAEIISWNIWQMDGLRGVVPGSFTPEVDLFGNATLTKEKAMVKNPFNHDGLRCKVMDWVRRKPFEYLSLL